jgi:hypothetical protein
MTEETTNQFSESEVEEWFDDEDEPSEETPAPTTDPATKYAKSQLRVVRETKEYQLDYLKYALEIERGLIDTAPTYQRRLRWNQKKRSLLIESFLLNIPIPPIFLFEHDYNEYEVIDGRQRLETIKSFLANNFALTGLKYWPELNRKRFNDLPNVLQKGLLRRSLSAVVLLAETSNAADDDLDVRTVLFDRLNTGGVGLNPQELRNALYAGPLNATLIKIARSMPFTAIWGIPPYTEGEEDQPSPELLANILFQTMADVELVLRFFAIRDALANNQKGSLRRILDNFMKDNAKQSQSVLDGYKVEFQSLIGKLNKLWEGRPFRIPDIARPSRPLYDALMIALSRKPELDLEADAEGIKRRMAEALGKRSDYDILVGRGNSISTIKQRVDLASKILQGEG